MRWLFVVLIWVLIASDIAGRTLGLGPGLSIKNALLYVSALALFFRLALLGRLTVRLPAIQICFLIWIAYAVLSWVAAAVVIHYHGYEAIRSAITLKSALIDSALFFLTVFYGVQDERDFNTVMKALALAITASSVATLTDVVGLTSFGTRIGDSGAEADRVFGAFGNANESAALLIYITPAIVAVALSSIGVRRLAWFAGAMICLAVTILTVSRGAFVAMAIGYTAAIFICRRYLPASKVIGWTLGAVAAVIVAVGAVGVMQPRVAGVVEQRLLGTTSTIDMGEASSGRNAIWAKAVGEMTSEPLTLVTGFGWDAYTYMPFFYVTHNEYLDTWFNLGLIGLGAFLGILGYSVITARRAADVATPEMRNYMIAFVFGMLAFAVAIFFTNTYVTRPYVWMFVGLTMRGAVFSFDRAAQISAEKAAQHAAAARASASKAANGLRPISLRRV